ncbi:hypothetical protein [Thermogymnomonas acidicola]|uniref:hypothetical protein n=1 Tax=Thermogymnomonas acidicola TaxID=399579 RepID=UPI001E2A53DB|nr:hypothetical protein [Thermogymnomonas acidicola]
MNFDYGHSLYNDSLSIFLVNASSHPHQWFRMMEVDFTEQTRTVIQNIYHNSTVPKPYIPPIVYVVIAVLFASTVAFGIRGNGERDELNRIRRRRN